MIGKKPNSSINIVEKHINKGLDVNKVDETTEETLLMFSARVGNLDLAKLLIRKGANEDQRNIKGENAYMIAIKSERFELADFLLFSGSDPNSIDE